MKDIPFEGLGALGRLDGRTAVVTGSTAGLGFQIARGFAAAGATVAVHGRDADKVSASAAKIPGASAMVFDLIDFAAAKREIEHFIVRHGQLDVLVCNAAIRDRRFFSETNSETLRELVETNLVANFELVRLVVPQMIDRKGGRIIFVTSTAASRGPRQGSTYAASKGGLDALTRSLAVELGGHNIRVNAISPGFFITEYNESMAEDPLVGDMIQRRVPMKRWGSPVEIIGPALLLASDAGAYINGQTIVVDGGMTIAA